jgi:hypothetical protein
MSPRTGQRPESIPRIRHRAGEREARPRPASAFMNAVEASSYNFSPKGLNTKRRYFSYFRDIPFVERLIYYALIPELFARVVLEFGLGMFSFALFEQKLAIYYCLLFVEYLFQIRKLVNAKFYQDQSLTVALFLSLLALHGALLGVGWKNNPVKIATDTIPLVVAVINIILAMHRDAFKGMSFDRITRMNIAFVAIMVVFGVLAVKLGKPSVVSLGGAVATTVSITIIVVSVWGRRKFSIKFLLFTFIVFGLIAPNFNRTTLAFLLIASMIIFFRTIAISGFRLYSFFVLIGIAVVALPLVVPPESPLGRRIEAMSSSSAVKQGSGSVGEREEESAAIDQKISQGGLLAQMIGFGHGAVYDMVFSNGFAPPNYSNAHFGWALFKLRYGYSGYVYLTIFALFVMKNIYRNAHSTRPFNRMILIIGLASIGYIITYMVFNIIASGLQFMHQRQDQAK